MRSRKPGRPKLKPERRRKTLTVRVRPDLYERLHRYCLREESSLSRALDGALEHFLYSPERAFEDVP